MVAHISNEYANPRLRLSTVSGCLIALFLLASPKLASAQDADQTPPKQQQPATNPDEINERLTSKRVSVKFEAVPLADAIDFIGLAADVNTFVDWKALEPMGIDQNAQVTIKLRNPVSAAQALRLVLRTVHPGLNFGVEEEVVIITGSAEAQPPQPPAADLETRVYDVMDLLNGANNSEAIVDLVTQSITPDAWKSDANSSRVTLLAGRLVVTAPQPTHDQINELFTKLRHATPTGVVPEAPADTTKKDDK